jgi:hypothetical protein
LRELNGRTLGNITAQSLAKICGVICVYFSVEACARHRNVREARIDEIWMGGAVTRPTLNRAATSSRRLGSLDFTDLV